MFRSVSRHNGRAKHSSLQLTTNSTAATLYKVSPILCRTDLRITNHRGHKFPPSLNAPFILNSNRMALQCCSVDCNREFFKRILSTTAAFKTVSRYHPSFSALKTALMTKTTLIFPVFFLRFVDLAVQFCFRCKFSFHGKPFKSS